jgi:hypothetical protein
MVPAFFFFRWIVSTATVTAARAAIARFSGSDHVTAGAVGPTDKVDIYLAELLQGLVKLRVNIGGHSVRFQLLQMLD